MINWLLLHGLEVIFVTAAVAGFSLGVITTTLWFVRAIMSGRLTVKDVVLEEQEPRILSIGGSR